jgi:AcrR family transcriptional regulator
MSEASDEAKQSGQPRPRRTQAERSAETRRALIEAAIECLQTYGYAGTSTTLIAERAGVSRGAMTHQFATKIELVREVIRHGYQSDITNYTKAMASVPSEQAFYQLPRLGWEAYREGPSIAVTEIMMASRSDPDLARELRALQSKIERDARERMISYLGRAGHAPNDDFGALHRLLTAALRGLAIDAMFLDVSDEIEGAVDLLCRLTADLYPAVEPGSLPE